MSAAESAAKLKSSREELTSTDELEQVWEGLPPDVGSASCFWDLLQQQQNTMQLLVDMVSRTAQAQARQASSGGHGHGSAGSSSSVAARKFDIPVLQCPEDTDLTSFADWKARWHDYTVVTRFRDDARDAESQQAILRSALHQDWSVLWQTGRLGVKDSDDAGTVIRKLEAFLRKQHNPLLDRRAFHDRNQQEQESVDQYYMALVRIDDRCAYEDDHLYQN